MQSRRRVRSVSGLAAALLLATGLALLPSAPALAHATLISAEPASGSQLDSAPAQIRLRFNERVTVAPDGIRLYTGDGDPIETGPATVHPASPTEAVLAMPAELPHDTYLVTYRVVSADSHPIAGAIVFSIGVPVAALSDLEIPATDPALSAAFTVARFTGYAALGLLTGALMVLVLCWPAGWHHRRARRLLRAGWVASIVSAVTVLLLQGAYAAGRPLTDLTDAGLLSRTLATDYGRYVLVRIGLLLVAGGLLLAATNLPGRIRQPIALGLAVALPATWIGTGHSNTGGRLDLAVDTAHLIAMTGWFGGLVLLAVCLLPRVASGPPEEVAHALRRFSLLATGSVAVLVTTGLYIAWREVGSFAALAGTSYGRLLAFKLAVVGLLLWLGAISRSTVQRRYRAAPSPAGVEAAATRSARRAARTAEQTEERSRGQLRQSVRLEVGAAIAVLAVVAVLVATPPGVVATRGVVTAEAAGPVTTEPVRHTVPLTETADGGTLRVLVDPARPGENRIVISVWEPVGDLWDVPEVRASLSLPEQEIGPLTLELTKLGPGEYEVPAAQLTTPGSWRLDVTVRTSEIDSTTLRLDVPIS